MTERREILHYFGRRLARFKSFVLQSIVILLLMSIVNLPLPLLNKVTFDYLIPSGEWVPIIWIGLIAFAVRAMASAFQVFQNYLIRCVITGMGHELRDSMVKAMLRAPYSDFVRGRIMDYTGRFTADVNKIENLVFDGMRFVVRPLGMISIMLVFMLWADPLMTGLLFATAPVCIFAARRLEGGLRHYEQVVLEKRQALQTGVSEVLDNIRIIRSFNKQERYEGQINENIDIYSDAAVSLAVRRQLMNNIVQIILLIPWICLVCVGAYRVHQGMIEIGDLMLFITFEGLVRSPLGQLTYFVSKFNADLVAPERVKEVNEHPREHNGTLKPDQCHGAIQIENISFAYDPSTPVLEQFSLDIPAGKRVALVGTSGGGKSTLMNLLLGFYQSQSGHISIDGNKLNELDSSWYRQHIGMVFQDNPMFDGTIRNNLCLDRAYTDEAIWDALERAQAADYVHAIKTGLETRIGTKGLKLSGGQRQRLAIARVILRNPAIVLMDEATSSLDSATEVQIQRAMDNLLDKRTSITIAHRLSTIVNADLICYLEHGKIIEQGTHQELIAKQGAYYKLYETQVDGLL